ncbi:MAG TPA: hypothetical protein VGF82_16245 [Terracidiphilus sp.]|jgi:hypothetical protein
MRAEQESPNNPSPIGDSEWFDREVGWLRADADKVRWLIFGVLSALILYLIVIAKFATGPVNVFHNDVLMLLDDGWRVLNGQVPHHDFNSPLGPLEFWIIGGGMLLAKGSAQGLAIGIAAFALVLGIWGWLLSRQRLPALFALLATIWLVFTASSPTPLGFDPRYLSCAMIYNRQGYALLGIILVECAFAGERPMFWGGLSSGAALILLAILKLNFFGIAGLLLLVSVPLRSDEIDRLWGFLAGSSATVLALLLYPRFVFARFFADMSFVSHARASSLSPSGLFHAVVTCAKAGTSWLVIATTIAIVMLTAPEQRRQRQTVTLVLLSLIVLASGPLFLQTNSLENRAQLASLWIIILLERISAMHQRVADKRVTVILIALSLGGIAAALIPDASSAFTLLGYQSSTAKGDGFRVDAPGMEQLEFYNSSSFYDKVKAGDGDGAYYASTLNDGLALLRNNSTAQESILALGFHNPFSYLLRRKPAEGGSSYLFMGNSISESQMPSVDHVFGNADLMIVPHNEGTHRDSDLFIQNYYRSYLLANFHLVAQSQYWSLYHRNK